MEREGADDVETDESRSPDTLCHDVYHNLTTTNTEQSLCQDSSNTCARPRSSAERFAHMCTLYNGTIAIHLSMKASGFVCQP